MQVSSRVQHIDHSRESIKDFKREEDIWPFKTSVM